MAYARGVFPMGKSRHDPSLHWVDPDLRGILPLDRVHVSRRLRRVVRENRFEVRRDTAFEAVIRACAAPAPQRWSTWINDQIISLYGELHEMGRAHSVESWHEERLVGGLYGISLGAAFFGESMFSRQPDASKVALVHLIACLRRGGFQLLDVQFVTRHLAQFGSIEISRELYRAALAAALKNQGDFSSMPAGLSGAAVLQSVTQTS
jgi:leucyl/phenylalanyl-tRNA--protein transferase